MECVDIALCMHAQDIDIQILSHPLPYRFKIQVELDSWLYHRILLHIREFYRMLFADVL